MTPHADFRDDSITAKADNDITKSAGTTIYKTPANLQHTLHGVPHFHSEVFIRCSPTIQNAEKHGTRV